MDNPGGYVAQTTGGDGNGLNTSGGSLGDVIYYNWGNGRGDDHVTILASQDSGFDWVDSHTNARYHWFWTLQDINPRWQTTTISTWHVSASN